MNLELSSLSCQGLVNLLAEQIPLARYSLLIESLTQMVHSSALLKCHLAAPNPWQLSGKLATKSLR